MKQYIVDAFTNKIFHGNPAAVCVLDYWLDESIMMQIAADWDLILRMYKGGSEFIYTELCFSKFSRGGLSCSSKHDRERHIVRKRSKCYRFIDRQYLQLIPLCPIVKTIEVHSGLTGLIAEKTIVENESGLDQFDAMWISSLCDSTAKGKPDIELV